MTFSERMYLQDQEAQRFDAENAPCDCGERLCYQCGPAYDADDEQPVCVTCGGPLTGDQEEGDVCDSCPDPSGEDTEQDGPFEERFENAQFEDAEDRYLDSSWEDAAEAGYYGD